MIQCPPGPPSTSGPLSRREQADEELFGTIEQVHTESGSIYESFRINRALQNAGQRAAGGVSPRLWRRETAACPKVT